MEGTVKELVYGRTRGSNWEWTGKEPMKETVKEIGNKLGLYSPKQAWVRSRNINISEKYYISCSLKKVFEPQKGIP